MRRVRSSFLASCCVLALAASVRAGDAPTAAPALEQELRSEGPEALARAARAEGEPARGALVFYRADLACNRCHLGDDRDPPLGPDLATIGKDATGPGLVEAILDPSKTIRKGFETVAIVTREGKTLTGRLVEERPDAVVLRDPAPGAAPVRVARADIEERDDRGPSLMPAGMANQLSGRQEFLDLVRYLIEIAEKGPARAVELRPDPSLLVPPPLPEYEKNLDHAGIIAGLDRRSYARGEEIYGRVCVNCHGNKEQAGSLPNSPRFGSGKFKNGSDPFSMYQTLTRGFGQMLSQAWMVPSQKYDVIHYIREAYLKEDNPTRYVPADREYLARLPRGTTRGPLASDIQPWVAMDYGPSLMATLEVGDDGTNFAYKGIAVRLDAGQGGVSRGRQWTVYEHDTLRVAASWTGAGFIDWNGINFNGKHQVHPRVVGLVHVANPAGPGWANPVDGRFDDPRPRGRDGRPYGPLPRDWARYRGLYHHGNRAIVSYTVGATSVLEMPGVESSGPSPIFTRAFELGPRAKDLVLQVAHLPRTGPALRTLDSDSGPVVVLGEPDDARSSRGAAPPSFDGATRLEVNQPEDFDMSNGDYTVTVRIRTRQGGSIFARAAAGDRKWARGCKALFVRGGRLVFDVGWVGAVTSRGRVDDDRWHDVALVYEHEGGRVRLFVDGRADGEGRLGPGDPVKKPAVRIGHAAPDFPGGRTYFDGRMTEVRFYDRALSGEEVAAADLGEDHLVARWAPEAAEGEAIADATGHGHDGRIDRGRTDPVDRVGAIAAHVSPRSPGFEWRTTADGQLRLKVPAGAGPLRFALRIAGVATKADLNPMAAALAHAEAPPDLSSLTRGGAAHWPVALATEARLGRDDGPFAADVLTHPANNPWLCQMRFTGFDFFPGGREMAVCTWDGDVWRVDGIDDPARGLTWRRIASGLFQPLGLKIVEGAVYVGCRDQICILRDHNGDGEADFYECFNDDHQVTEHFHEFAMDLQADAAGNFYYAKAARHGLPALVPQHGTLLRVSKDGRRTDILANGFRAPNGVCPNPDGTFFMTDQEGFWLPKNRINRVKVGGFYGNMWGYHDVTDPSDAAMEPPICWITNAFDRSPGQVVRVEGDSWGPLRGALLELSYGYGKVFVIPHETVDGLMQGGMAALPIPQFATGIMRGRFHPGDGHLFTCGMYAWAATQTQPGGFYRVRPTGRPAWVPVGLSARKDGMAITFGAPLDRGTANDPRRYAAKTWALKRSEKYGSEHIDERASPIAAATLSDDGRTVFLDMPEIAPTWCMEIKYSLKGFDGANVDGMIHNTIHRLRDPSAVSGRE